MSNRRILQQMAELYEQFNAGEISVEQFARQVRGHSGALEGLDDHAPIDRIETIMFHLMHPNPPRDGNIPVPRTKAETQALLHEYEDWFRDVSAWIDRHEPGDDDDD